MEYIHFIILLISINISPIKLKLMCPHTPYSIQIWLLQKNQGDETVTNEIQYNLTHFY